MCYTCDPVQRMIYILLDWWWWSWKRGDQILCPRKLCEGGWVEECWVKSYGYFFVRYFCAVCGGRWMGHCHSIWYDDGGERNHVVEGRKQTKSAMFREYGPNPSSVSSRLSLSLNLSPPPPSNSHAPQPFLALIPCCCCCMNIYWLIFFLSL